MRTHRPAAAALSGLCLAAALTVGHSTTAAQSTSWQADTSTDGATTCEPYTATHHDAGVAAGTIHPDMWDDLLGIGWQGRQDDRREALYAPGCY